MIYSISTDEERESMRKFFEYALDIKRVPLGRIPSVDEVPCMSQAAINLITDESGITPLFSKLWESHYGEQYGGFSEN